MSMWHKLELFGKANSHLKNCPHKMACWHVLVHFYSDWFRGGECRGPVYCSGVTPGLLVLGATRKLAEQALSEQAREQIHQWPLLQFLTSGSCSEFLPWLPSTLDCHLTVVSLNKPLDLFPSCSCNRDPNSGRHQQNNTGNCYHWLCSVETGKCYLPFLHHL